MGGTQDWRRIAGEQDGLITRSQLATVDIDRRAVAHRVRTERWQILSPVVIATTTGPLSVDQRVRLGLLHAGGDALVGGLTVAARRGLKNWEPRVITVLVPYGQAVPTPLDGVEFVRSRRNLRAMRDRWAAVPSALLEPAVLLWAARQRSDRTAQGLINACLQQRLTSVDALESWLGTLQPLPKASVVRDALRGFAGGAQSVAELDVAKMCRRFGLARPQRQIRRRDSGGRARFTDCEWRAVDGAVVVLEVDGSFHMSADQWEDDLARQRALTSVGVRVVRCTAREIRDQPDAVARDLRRLGVPVVSVSGIPA